MAAADLDESVIQALQLDGRASVSNIASNLGLSRATVTARMNELIESDQIRIVAAVHPRVLGLNAIAHLAIKTSKPAHEIAEHLRTLEGSVFISLATGAFPLICEIRLPGLIELNDCLEYVRNIDGVEHVEVLLYRTIERSLFLSVEPPIADTNLDETDLDILTELQLDGRVSFEQLGQTVGLSTSAARSRFRRLLDLNVMQIGAIRTRAGTSAALAVGIGVSTTNQRQAIDFFKNQPGVEFVTSCIGRFDVVATIGVPTAAEFIPIIEAALKLDAIHSIDSWAHLVILQERYERSLETLRARRREITSPR